MAKYEQYAEYKNSGVEWLGDIPEHWKLLSGKRVFNSVREKALSTDQQLAASQKYGVIPQSIMMKLNDAKVMLALKGTDSFRHVRKDSFVISLRSFEGGIEHSNYDGCVSPAYTVLEATKSISPKFYKYLFKSAPYIAALQSSTDSLRDGKSISYDQFGFIPLPVFAIDEQDKVANFLDYETAQIDTLIEKQQTLIQLLKEKRQTVISHAVTKGLNPDAPMKDSGVEWLGEVPEHWDVTKLGFHTSKIGSGKTPRGGAEVYQEEGVLFLRSQNVYNDSLRIDKSESVFISEVIHEEMSNTKVQGGDILLNVTGGSIGRTCIVPDNFIEANVNQHVCIVRLPTSMRYFVAFLLKSSLIKEQIDSIQTGGNREGLNFEQISKFIICLPPEKERKDIVDYIESETNKIDNLLEQANTAIQLMQERRTALISAAVTGKIDVRGWQAPESKTTLESL